MVVPYGCVIKEVFYIHRRRKEHGMAERAELYRESSECDFTGRGMGRFEQEYSTGVKRSMREPWIIAIVLRMKPEGKERMISGKRRYQDL